MVEKRALGKGLAALIGEKQAQVYKRPVPLFSTDEMPAKKGEIVYLDVAKIIPGKYQPREDFDAQRLNELISSIKEQGLLQPILVRKIDTLTPLSIPSTIARDGERKSSHNPEQAPGFGPGRVERVDLGFEIIAGERRFRAAKALALEKIPAIVKDVQDKDALVISLIENIQRESLNVIEEAHAFQQLIDQFNFSQEEIAKAVGKDNTTISNTLRLLKLPQDIQRYLEKGQITFGHAKVLLATNDIEKQRKLCQLIISNSLSVRELESQVNVSLAQRKRRAVLISKQDPHIVSLERALQIALGTKVRIIAHKKRGKIVIDYYSPVDLERIVDVVKKILKQP